MTLSPRLCFLPIFKKLTDFFCLEEFKICREINEEAGRAAPTCLLPAPHLPPPHPVPHARLTPGVAVLQYYS